MLINTINKTIYKSKIDDRIIKDAIEFVDKFNYHFQEKSWDCSIRTSGSVTSNILNCKNLIQLKVHILSHLDNYMHLNNNYYDGYIRDSWINIYEKGYYQEFHNHVDEINKHYSGVMYLSENNSDIEFGLEEHFKITPQLGDILIFNEDYFHRVLPNEQETLRVSLAFNFKKTNKWDGLLIEQ